MTDIILGHISVITFSGTGTDKDASFVPPSPPPAGLFASGFGDIAANGTYDWVNSINGKDAYSNGTYFLFWYTDGAGGWAINSDLGSMPPKYYRDAQVNLIGTYTVFSGTPPRRHIVGDHTCTGSIWIWE